MTRRYPFVTLDVFTDTRFDITQGVEMGRPSLIRAAAWRDTARIRASVGGNCVPVLRGEALL